MTVRCHIFQRTAPNIQKQGSWLWGQQYIGAELLAGRRSARSPALLRFTDFSRFSKQPKTLEIHTVFYFYFSKPFLFYSMFRTSGSVWRCRVRRVSRRSTAMPASWRTCGRSGSETTAKSCTRSRSGLKRAPCRRKNKNICITHVMWRPHLSIIIELVWWEIVVLFMRSFSLLIQILL